MLSTLLLLLLLLLLMLMVLAAPHAGITVKLATLVQGC